MLYSTIIGIDAHAKTNEICAIDKTTGEIKRATLSADPKETAAWIKALNFSTPLKAVYESGPTGFALARVLGDAGIECSVCATSKLPSRKDKKKTDRSDAEYLARMLDSGSVREVRIPSEAEEALRNLVRLRNDTSKDLTRAKLRVTSFLLLKGIKAPAKNWTWHFKEWAHQLIFEQEIDTYVFAEKFAEVLRIEERLKAIWGKIEAVIETLPKLKDSIARLKCVYGIGDIVALTVICEVMDFKRFRNAQAFASFIGLTPSEDSSGERRATGAITKTGNTYVRTALIEAANCYFRPSRPYAHQDLSVNPLIRAHAAKCTKRLKKRYASLKKRKKQGNKIKVAIAREMAEWIYHLMIM